MSTVREIASKEELEKYRDLFAAKPWPRFIRLYHAIKMELENKIPYAKFHFYVTEAGKSTYYFGIYFDDFHPGDRGGCLTIESEGEFDYDEFVAAIKETFPEPDTIGLILAKKTYTTAMRKFCTDLYPEYGPVSYFNETREFYMKKDKEQEILDNEVPEFLDVEEYELTVGDPEKDAEAIHDTWRYSLPQYVNETVAKLRHLPNVCIKKDGVPVSYILLTFYGKFCHQFTVEEYRKRGLGTVVENELMKKALKWVKREKKGN
ncbi:hypothetical protein WR25_22744 isoform B [Diploscapter pachys]|uniref:Glycine N-acyltransferase-like protein n=1 Tax=Diploscapter pachys TaxID=2018661 RepID=A0A2A2KV29_9BILA|nr:hypothetical protein WR25_22744 isoform B [Diploscapter pachys]